MLACYRSSMPCDRFVCVNCVCYLLVIKAQRETQVCEHQGRAAHLGLRLQLDLNWQLVLLTRVYGVEPTTHRRKQWGDRRHQIRVQAPTV